MCNKESFLASLDSNALDSWRYFMSKLDCLLDCSEIYLNFTATNNYDCRFMFETEPRDRVLGRVFWQPRLQRFCFHCLADNNSINIFGILNSEPHDDGPQRSRFYLNIKEMKDTFVIAAVSNALKKGIDRL